MQLLPLAWAGLLGCHRKEISTALQARLIERYEGTRLLIYMR
jgi:hypothetical protein